MNDAITLRQLIEAYLSGYFPMPEEPEGELLWYRPDPRAVLELNDFHCSKSLKRSANKFGYIVTFNRAFWPVMYKCSERDDTWIDNRMMKLYTRLHFLELAQSVEVWTGDVGSLKLVGGLYGVCVGGAFFAESKFHTQTDASKWALFGLVTRMRELQMNLLEVQFLTPHLKSLGVSEISDEDYQKKLQKAIDEPMRNLT